MNYNLRPFYNLAPLGVMLTVLLIGCSPDVQLRLVSVDELYRDSILQDSVTMVEDTVDLDRKRMLRRRYSLNGEGVLDEFIMLGRNGWGAGPIIKYLDARVFFLGECLIKRVEYFGELDSAGQIKFEGSISKTRYTWCGKLDSVQESWYRTGYKKANPDAKYFWDLYEESRQLSHRATWNKGKQIKATWWFDNGQLKITNTQDSLKDSLKTITRWHKNGIKKESTTSSFPKGGIIRSKWWNQKGVLVRKTEDSGNMQSTWSDTGRLMYVHHMKRTTAGRTGTRFRYENDTIYSETQFVNGQIVSEQIYGKQPSDSSMFYFHSAWDLERAFRRDTDDVLVHIERLKHCYDRAIQHDVTNIDVYWKKMSLYSNDFKAKREIIEPLWRLDSTLFNCDQTLFYAYLLMHDRENSKAVNVLTLALERWDNNLRTLYEVYEKRAEIYIRLLEFEKACSDINRVIEYKFYSDARPSTNLTQLKKQYSRIIQHCK